jgi:hypothetical protein
MDMMLRQKYIDSIIDRSWKQIVTGEVIVKRQTNNEKGGFLNAIRDIDYEPYTLRNCDMFILSGENKNTRVGIKILGDAAVWLSKVQIVGLNETDIIEISGIDYRIVKVDLHDSFYKDRVRVDLARV